MQTPKHQSSVYSITCVWKQFKFKDMDTCIVEKCQINMTVHWSGKVAEVSLRVFDVSYWTCTVVMMIFGIPLNVGIINYEWYGGDPQKRSLSNRMMSSYVIAHCVAGVNLHTFAGFMRYLSRRIREIMNQFISHISYHF